MEQKPYLVAKYVIGFSVCLLLTAAAYVAVTQHLFGGALIPIIVGLASVQVLVQLVFFLHLGEETKPRWKLVVFIFMLMVLAILVCGSLWIMQNLNYHMSSDDTNTYLIKDEGVHGE